MSVTTAFDTEILQNIIDYYRLKKYNSVARINAAVLCAVYVWVSKTSDNYTIFDSQ